MLVSAPPTFLPRFKNLKQPLTTVASLIALVGIVILYVTPAEPQYQGRRLASCIIISCSGVNYTVIMSVIGGNVAGFTKKQFTTSTAFFLYCIVNIITPQTFLGTESPRYHTGLGFVMGYVSMCLVSISNGC
jgi:ACS family allantoate permease-like MFS transporter